MQLKTNNDFTSINLAAKLDSKDADRNINSHTTESSSADICPVKRTEIVNVISSIQAADVCDDDLLNKVAGVFETDADSIVKDADTFEKDADSVKNDADSTKKDSASHSGEDEKDSIETNTKFLLKDDDTHNAEIKAIVSGSKKVNGECTDVENFSAAYEDDEAQNSSGQEGKGVVETTPGGLASREDEAKTSTGKAVSTEGDVRSTDDPCDEDVSRNEDEIDPNNNSNNNNNGKADDEKLLARPISPTATTTTIKIVNVKVSVRRPSEDFEGNHEHAEQTYPLESSV